MTADVNYYIQAIIGVFVITDPVTRGFFFKVLTENEPERRREYVRKITIAVAVILGVSALVGHRFPRPSIPRRRPPVREAGGTQAKPSGPCYATTLSTRNR